MTKSTQTQGMSRSFCQLCRSRRSTGSPLKQRICNHDVSEQTLDTKIANCQNKTTQSSGEAARQGFHLVPPSESLKTTFESFAKTKSASLALVSNEAMSAPLDPALLCIGAQIVTGDNLQSALSGSSAPGCDTSETSNIGSFDTLAIGSQDQAMLMDDTVGFVYFRPSYARDGNFLEIDILGVGAQFSAVEHVVAT